MTQFSQTDKYFPAGLIRRASLHTGAFLLALTACSAFGQGIITGKISGTIQDPSGAIVPNAAILATNNATNAKYTGKSGADGSFSLNDVAIGTYTIIINSSGFAPLTVGNLQVSASRTTDTGIEKLQTGQASETVEVSTAQNLLETTTGQVTTTFDAQQLTNLPTAGGFDEVALLIPGVTNTRADNFSNSNGVNFSVNGERGRSNNFELDGQSNNDNSIAGPQAFFGNDEAIAQIQVITNDFGAQYGRNAGSVINYITKSGTNQFHGSAIYRYSGDFTSSLSQGYSKGTQFGFCAPGQDPATDGCGAAVAPRYVENYYGGTFGGPIIKDKLFGFGSTYWYRLAEYGALASSGSHLFPTPTGLSTLAAAFPNSRGVAILQQLSPYNVAVGNPHATSAPVNETITSNGVSVSVPFAQFGRQIPTLGTDEENLGRLDWQATPKDRVYVRFFYQNNPTTPGDSLADGGFYNVSDDVYSVGSDLTHTFSPRWVDQLRYSFQQSTLAFNAGGFTCTITNFANCPSSVTINGSVDNGAGTASSPFTALGLQDIFPQGRIVKAGQVQDNANWLIGKHAITFGGEFDYTNSPNTFLPESSGVYTFDNLNDFISGTCASTAGCSANLAIGKPVIPFKEDDYGLYIQDDWKVSPNLTLNLGVRYEFFQQAINLLHNESVANQTGPNPLWTPTLPLSQTTLPAVPNYYKNIEPRIGFAFNPGGASKLVVRGGYAINVDPQFYNINLNVATSAPLVTFGSVNCTGAVNCLPTGGATFSTSQQQVAKLLPAGGNPGADTVTNVAPNFRNPLSQTYTLAVEYQVSNAAVFEVRYTGNHTDRQFQSINSNPYLAPVATSFPNSVNPASLCSAANSTLPDGADIGHIHCGFSTVNTITNTAFNIYNAIEGNLTTHNYHGVSATFSFTHSKNIDNASEIYSNAGGSNQGGNTIAFAQNPLDIDQGERGTSGIDFPNVASISFTYKFPTFKASNDIVKRLVGGWQANTVWFYSSGQPYTDYEAINSGSPQINPNDARTSSDFGDQQFENAVLGLSVERPILSNKNAPAGTLGIYTTTGGANGVPLSGAKLVDYATGAPVTPAQVRFIANNQLAALVLGNPYPGSSRNLLRGNTTNDVDFSVFKDTRVTERINFRLEAQAYDVLNRAFYGTPDPFESHYSSSASTFNNFFDNYATGATNGPGTTGVGTRLMIFGAKVLF